MMEKPRINKGLEPLPYFGNSPQRPRKEPQKLELEIVNPGAIRTGGGPIEDIEYKEVLEDRPTLSLARSSRGIAIFVLELSGAAIYIVLYIVLFIVLGAFNAISSSVGPGRSKYRLEKDRPGGQRRTGAKSIVVNNYININQ